MTHIFNNIMDGGYFMAFGTLSPIQRRCKEFTESVLQEVLAIRQRERYLNNIKACITGYPPADEAEPFVCENFSQYQFFQPMDDIVDYSDRFDYLMCCLAAGVCKVQKGFEERYQQSIIKVLTFRSTACPNTPLGYILSPELLPLVRYEEDNSDEETEEEEGQQGDGERGGEVKEEQQLLLQNNDSAGANTPSRPTTSGSASTPAAAAQQMIVVTSTPQQPSSESALAVGASPSSPSKSVRKILTEKEQLLNDVDFDTSGLTVQEIAAEQVRRKGLQSEIIDDYIANKDAYVFSVKDELRRLLAEDEKEEKEKILRELADKPSFISGGEGEFVSSKTPDDEVEDVVEKQQQEVITDSSAPPQQDDGDVTPPPAGSEEIKEEEEEAPTPSAIEVMTLPPRVEEEEEKSSEEPPVKMMNTLELVLLCKADHIASQSPATAVVGDEDEL